MDVEVTPENEKNVLKETLPYFMDLGILARNTFATWGLRFILGGGHSDKVKPISGIPEKSVRIDRKLLNFSWQFLTLALFSFFGSN